MVQCFKCNKRGNLTQHHIDGNGTHLPLEDQNNDPSNLITLCPSCHDIVEGVCNQCYQRDDCNRTRFMDCWRFEDAIPPLHFKKPAGVVVKGFLIISPIAIPLAVLNVVSIYCLVTACMLPVIVPL